MPHLNSKPKNNVLEPSRSKRRVFFAATLLTPVVLLVLLELFLRLINYGPDLSLFTTVSVQGQDYCAVNAGVKGRYFHQIDFDPATSPDVFAIAKPAGTFRIFCLGASTTAGYPYWFNGSFSTFLRDRLKAIFPQKNIEVVNLGITATNSYAVADIAHELPAWQPDCIIVYDGHNEFYGALGVASRESLGRSPWVNHVYLRLVHLRVFVLMRDLLSAITGLFRKSEADLPPATVMERLSRGQEVPYDSELYRQGLDVFRQNLEELREICAREDIPLILSTQVSNLRRQQPFVSGAGSQTPAERVAFNMSFNAALANYLDGDFPAALAKLQAIQGPETLRADLHFRSARCLDTLSRYGEASREYLQARDLDQVRFRASSDFNNAIRAMGEKNGVVIADVENTFAVLSPDSLIGYEYITEHLHPNLEGYFLMARIYAGILRTHGLIGDVSSWLAADTLSEARLWGERNTTRIDEMIGEMKTAVLTSGWPFKDQPPTVPPVGEKDTLGQIVELFARGEINWKSAHLGGAAYYALRQEMRQAAREYQVVAAEIPSEAPPLMQVSDALNRSDTLERAVQELREIVKSNPSNREAVQLLRWIGGTR